MHLDSIQSARRRRLLPGLAGALAGLGLMAASLSVLGQTSADQFFSNPSITVTTLGGGPIAQCGPWAGDTDGNTLDDSQFNYPNSAAADGLGNLYIADTKNNRVRVVTDVGSTATSETTYLDLYFVIVSYIYTNSSKGPVPVPVATNRVNYAAGVVAVAEDAANDLYVLGVTNSVTVLTNKGVAVRTTNTFSVLTVWDQYRNEIAAPFDFPSSYSNATAMTVSRDPSTNVFVAFANGAILRFNFAEGLQPVVPSFPWKPAGLALLPYGKLAVSDTLNNAIYLVGTNKNSTPTNYVGGNYDSSLTNAGYVDGSPRSSKFNQPHGLAATSAGQLVVADTMNNAVRFVETNGITTTLYGAPSPLWPAQCCACDPSVYPGWLDGPTGNSYLSAEARQPVSVVVASNGVYVTELYYDLLREATGTALIPLAPTNAPLLLAPSIAITNPVSSAQFVAPAAVNLGLSVSDTNAYAIITNIAVFTNNVIWTNNSTNTSFILSNLAVGSYTLMASASDIYGLSATSTPVTIYVVAPTPPSVSITSPANNATSLLSNNVSVMVLATDANTNGVVTNLWLYYTPTNNTTNLIGQMFGGVSNTVTFLWTNPPVGTEVLFAVARDNYGATATSAPVTIVIIPPQPPSIAIISPTNTAPFPVLQPVTISLSDSDPNYNGAITRIEVLTNGGVAFSNSTLTSYSLTSLPPGSYVLKAIATDNYGLSATSAPVAINIIGLQPPTVAIISPTNSAQFPVLQPVPVGVSFSDSNYNGIVTNIVLLTNNGVAFSNSTLISYSLTNLPVGYYTLTAIAMDNYGLSNSSAVTIYVFQPQPPIVSITSPANNTVVILPTNELAVVLSTNVAVTAAATDPNPNGTVLTIALYAATTNATNLIFSQPAVSNLPVNFSWSVSLTNYLGTNELTAVAMDSFGLTATSAPVTVIVTPPLLPPTFTPNYGYFPECQTIYVTSAVQTVYYTTDGSAPTTNSLAVTNMMPMSTNAQGQITWTGWFIWCNSQQDLTALRIAAASGPSLSGVVSGQSSPSNQIGFVRGVTNGAGSTVLLPIVVDLQSGGVLGSIQFLVEVTASGGSSSALPLLNLWPIGTNDFVPMIGPAPGNAPVAFIASPESPGPTNGAGLLISAGGLGSAFSVHGFAAVTLLAVQIPTTAAAGQTYELNVLLPSGTANGQQSNVVLVPMPPQTLTVASDQYFSGDSAPGNGYDPGEFGAGGLNSADVNNAMYASVGIRVPFLFSDAYNAMDAYPETATEVGDSFITYLDWQTILLRAEGLDTNNWVRFWTTNGVRSHARIAWVPGQYSPVPIGVPPIALPAELPRPKTPTPQSSATPPGWVWFRQAAITAGTLTNVAAGNSYSVPVYANVLPGYSLAGLQFRATLLPNGGAPPPGVIQFNHAPGIPTASQAAGLWPNDIVCAWNLGDFSPGLAGSNLLGWISFQVPAGAQPGQSYGLHFSGVGGGAADALVNTNSSYQMESVPGTAWVLSSALQPPQITSDEWRATFFGSTTNLLAADNADPDGDGSLNWQEYVAGTNPTNGLSRLQFSAISGGPAPTSAVTLSWLTAPGKIYLLQSTPTLAAPNWSVINTHTGDGNVFAFSLPNSAGKANFYRICVQP